MQAPGSRAPVVWLILDGVTHWVASRLLAEGRLPNLARLAASGSFRATRPVGPNCETPVQLATLFTGEPSRVHGVHGYHVPVDGEPHRTRSGFEADGLRATPLWRDALDAGRSVALGHIAFSTRGGDARHTGCRLLADGYGSAGDETFVAPHDDKPAWLDAVGTFRGNGELGAYLKGRFGPRFADGRAEDDYLRTLLDTSDYFARVARFVLERERADLTMLYYPCTDEIAHAVMHYLGDETHARSPDTSARAWAMVTTVYEAADTLVGEVVARLGGGERLVVGSDHGVAGIARRLHVNRVLADAGLCRFGPQGRLVRRDARVFYSPANNGFLHRGARFEHGDLDRACEALRACRTDGGMAAVDGIDLPGDAFDETTGIAFVRATPGYEVSALDAPRPITASVMKGHHQSGDQRADLRGVLFTDTPCDDPDAIVPNTAVRAIVEATRA